jgi:hypothetical protein
MYRWEANVRKTKGIKRLCYLNTDQLRLEPLYLPVGYRVIFDNWPNRWRW